MGHERFGDVIVGPRAKALHFIHVAPANGQEDDRKVRRARVVPQPFAQLNPGHPRQFNVREKEVGPFFRNLRLGLLGSTGSVSYTHLDVYKRQPSTHRHIGPILWKPDLPLPEWWSKIPSDKPLVYLTAGSTGQTRAFEKTVEALLDFPVVVVVATAERATVQRVPGRVFVADYLPGDEVSRRATLVINNGGSGGVYQALAAGVPVLGIAANMDQCMVMKSVVHAGAGMLVMERETKGYDWKKVLSHLLSSQQYKLSLIHIYHTIKQRKGSSVYPVRVLIPSETIKNSITQHALP